MGHRLHRRGMCLLHHGSRLSFHSPSLWQNNSRNDEHHFSNELHRQLNVFSFNHCQAHDQSCISTQKRQKIKWLFSQKKKKKKKKRFFPKKKKKKKKKKS